VRLVLDEGKSVTAVARELDLVASALGNWVKQTQADRSKGRTGLTTAEREELVRLRKALRIAEEDRDILKKATAFFAKQSRDETWFHRGEEGRAPRHDPLPVYARDAERVLRVDATRAVGARAARPGAENEAPRVPCRQNEDRQQRRSQPVHRIGSGPVRRNTLISSQFPLSKIVTRIVRKCRNFKAGGRLHAAEKRRHRLCI
jgi:transposase